MAAASVGSQRVESPFQSGSEVSEIKRLLLSNPTLLTCARRLRTAGSTLFFVPSLRQITLWVRGLHLHLLVTSDDSNGHPVTLKS